MKFLRKNEVAERIGWHPVHLMRQAKAGKFPAPVQIGANSIGFVDEEVDAWMLERVAERRVSECRTEKSDLAEIDKKNKMGINGEGLEAKDTSEEPDST